LATHTIHCEIVLTCIEYGLCYVFAISVRLVYIYIYGMAETLGEKCPSDMRYFFSHENSEIFSAMRTVIFFQP